MQNIRRLVRLSAWASLLLALPLGGAEASGKRVAILEEGSVASAGLAEWSLLAEGTSFELGGGESIVIGYMTSCQRETITGGAVTIGAKQSEVSGGTVAREGVQCAEPRLDLSAAESQQSATIAFRPADSLKHIYTRTPLLFGRGSPTIFLEIVEAESSRTIGKVQTEAGRIDLAQENLELEPGKTYLLKTSRNTVMVEVDAAAKAGGTTLERAVLVD